MTDINTKATKGVRWFQKEHSEYSCAGEMEYDERISWSCGEHEHDTKESANACIREKEDEKERYYLGLNCKPEKKIELIEREYWLCGHPRHKHTSEHIAKKCIIEGKNKLKEAPIEPKRTRREASDLRKKRTRKEISTMFMSVLSGQTFTEAGTDFGVSRTRARQIFNQTKRIIEHPEYEAVGEDKSVLVGIDTLTDIRESSDAMEFYRQRLRLWEHQK
jgi:hypothetical protein